MQKYIKKFNKLNREYKISVVAIGISTLLLLLLLIFVLIPMMNLPENDASIISASDEFDSIMVTNNVLSVLIVLSSVTSLVFVLLGRQKHAKKKPKK